MVLRALGFDLKGKTKMRSVICAIGSLLAAASFASSELPEGYKAIEYIESTKGGGQFIDTDYTANGQTEVVFDALVPERGTGQQADDFGVLFGSRTMNEWKLKAFALQMCGGNNGRNCVRFVYNGEYRQDGDKPFSFGERVTVTCDGQHVEWKGANEASVAFDAGALEHSKSTLYIFADNTVSGEDGTKNPAGTNPSVMRLYSFKIYEDETLKRNFVPCLRTADAVAGLYDTVEQKFYENKGNGAFGIPPDAFCTVTIGDYPNMTAAYTFGDGSVTNAVNGTSFIVLKDTENVKVIFAAKRNYEIDGDPVVRLEGAVTENIVFGVGNDYAVPKVRSVFGDITYLDWDDANRKMTNATLSATDYELVTSETTAFADGKWYVIADAVVIDNGSSIKVNGSAHLILCDNASLTIKNVGNNKAAIDVSASGSVTNALTIYGQQGGSGVLSATGDHSGASIGGGYHGAGGTVTVNGGTVTAMGGQFGAGIGGGYQGAGGTVTVNGGIVTATGGQFGAGIGGGYGGAGGVVTINGGVVTATGSDEGAGIGGGWRGADGTVTPGKNVEVIEGAVGNGSSYVKIVNTDEYPLVTVGAFEHMTAAWTSGDGAVTNAVNGTSFFVKKGTENVKVIFTAKQNYEFLGDPVVELEGAVTENIVFGVGNDYAVPKVRSVFGDITYLDWDDANRKMTNATLSATDYELVTSETTAFADGKWYVVADTVVIENGSNIKVNGSAHLILCDNASLTITNVATDTAAIDVSVSGSVTNALTIYGQQGGSGLLSATGGWYGAGIGGGRDGAGGTVSINGGTVTATGGYDGAGIGGGSNGAGGTVTVNGGIVTATGGQYGAGIGGGHNGAGGTVTVNGGAVTATGGQYGAGIGGGWYGAGGSLVVNGGTVTATGGDSGAGIGGGDSGAGGVVTINGGIVTATGSDGGAGIGGGWRGADGEVTRGPNVEVIEGAVGNGSSYVKIVNTDEYPLVTVGAFEHMTAAWTSGDGAVTNAVNGTSFIVLKDTENVKVIFAAKRNYEILGDPVVELEGAVTENIVFGVGNDYAVPKVRSAFGDIAYLDWDDANRKMTNATLPVADYELVTSETTAFADGKWYVIADDVVIDNGANIKVNGSAYLILCDNASLTIKNVGNNKAAIDVSAGGSVTNALTIYGQQGGSGVLSATGGSYGAGIGGGYQGAGGTVSVNGGTVTATGGQYGAGIGGGWYGAGGVVTVNGGLVTATGGYAGAGIGGGRYGADHGKVTFGAGAWLVLAGDSAPGSEVSAADYANDHRAAYAHIAPLFTLKIPAGVHYSYVVSNETAGTELKGVLADGTNTYMVVNGSTVKVYFTPDEDYGWDGEFDNPKNLGVIECDKVVDASEMPKVKGLPGSEVNPWSVGENVTAYIKDRVLYLKGSGAMNDFASAAEVPWAAVVDQVTTVTVDEGVTYIGENAFAGLANTVTVNGRTVFSLKLVFGPSEPTPVPVPPPGAVTTWDALTNAVATAESGAVIAVGADISEPDGVLTIAKGQAVTILLYGKVVSCQKVVVEGALTVGDADDSVGKIVAADGAQIGRAGSVVLLGGPIRGTFTSTTPGLVLFIK